jgi:hypothetical protein
MCRIVNNAFWKCVYSKLSCILQFWLLVWYKAIVRVQIRELWLISGSGMRTLTFNISNTKVCHQFCSPHILTTISPNTFSWSSKWPVSKRSPHKNSVCIFPHVSYMPNPYNSQEFLIMEWLTCKVFDRCHWFHSCFVTGGMTWIDPHVCWISILGWGYTQVLCFAPGTSAPGETSPGKTVAPPTSQLTRISSRWVGSQWASNSAGWLTVSMNAWMDE